MASAPRHFGLDLLRAGAILSVLLLHAGLAVAGLPARFDLAVRYGWIGVDLFFVLSGFLIAGQVLDAGEMPALDGVRRFWARRWTRTLPLYFVVLASYALVKPALFGAPFPFSWRYLVFLQNTAPLTDFIQSWSLCIEEQFYFLFPLIFFFLRPRHPAWYLVPLALSLLLRLQAWHALGLPATWSASYDPALFDRTFRFGTLRHLDGIALGVFLAATRQRWRAWPVRVRTGAAALALALLVASPLLMSASPGGLGAVFAFTWLSLLFGALLLGADAWARRPSGGAVVERVAVWSYGAYLWNNTLLRYMQRTPPHVPWPVAVLLFIGGSFVLAAVTYVVIEKPGMRLRKYLVR